MKIKRSCNNSLSIISGRKDITIKIKRFQKLKKSTGSTMSDRDFENDNLDCLVECE